ncbi:MAG TPA: XdhC/CoxI family protein [Thermodesulfovibrionales bacterium]|jgi:xanthine dehydrogenase accessory factor|nr:XdhC/CoxI family protein [Thermodesulfovibrionales bacterium]
MDIYEELLRIRKEGRPCALATIVQSDGSSPQKEGAKILVREDGSIVGTLGGGCIEAEVIDLSLLAIKDGLPQTIPFNLTEKQGGLLCGGKLLVFIEPILPKQHVVILGAGHVGKALSTVASFSGFRVTVVDDREEFANSRNLPHADHVVLSGFADPFLGCVVDGDSYIVIATRGHNHDFEALRAALTTEARFVGLVGSKRKKAVLSRYLKEAGFSDDDVARVITPVGLPIGSVTPEEIAISIMAQIIAKRRGNVSAGFSRSSCSGIVEEDGEAEAASSSR